MTIPTAGPSRRSPVRWWPAAILAALVAVALVWIWTASDVARDSRTGAAADRRSWSMASAGYGVGATLVEITGEDGAVFLIEPSRDGLRELARFQALEGKTWNTPAFAAPYLLVRNDVRAACYRLPLD